MKSDPIDTRLQLKALQKKPPPPIAKLALPVGAAFSTVMFGMATPSLIGADSLPDYIKCAALTGAAGFTLYTVNRFALEKGTFQAAIGSLPAALVSTVSMLAVGSALMMGTYHGTVKDEADRLRLQAYANDHAAWVEAQAGAAQSASRSVPVFEAVFEDLSRQAACEAQSSCVSGRGSGGFGPVARRLAGAQANAEAIGAEIAASGQSQAQSLNTLGETQRIVQSVLNDGSLSASERRVHLEQLSRNVGRLLSDLEQTSPETLITSFAQQLMRQSGSAPESRLLANYGSQLMSALDVEASNSSQPPAFPQPSGVSDTLRYIGHFLPIALVLFVADLALPMSLWLYAFIALRARLEEMEREAATPTQRRTSRKTPKQ